MSGEPIQIFPCDYAYVAQHKRAAARERVSISDTANTHWFRSSQHACIGGVLMMKGKARIKATYTLPEFRGMGYGTVMAERLMVWISDQNGIDTIEVLSVSPGFWVERMFNIVSVRPNGVARCVRGI